MAASNFYFFSWTLGQSLDKGKIHNSLLDIVLNTNVLISLMSYIHTYYSVHSKILPPTYYYPHLPTNSYISLCGYVSIARKMLDFGTLEAKSFITNNLKWPK